MNKTLQLREWIDRVRQGQHNRFNECQVKVFKQTTVVRRNT